MRCPVGPTASVEFCHVGFRYPTAAEISLASLESVATLDARPESTVLTDITFRVEAGQTVALVGRSGAGKTTMTHLIARLYDAQQGSVRVAGTDVRELRLDSLHAAVGYVTQDAHMFHDTIRANLAYAKPDADDAEMRAALAAARIGELVDQLPDGLDTVVGERGYRLSGGERQRLAIARLLLKAPADRGARRGHGAPGLGVGAGGAARAGYARWRAGPRSSSPTGCRPSAMPT